jgi:hypothetical protein
MEKNIKIFNTVCHNKAHGLIEIIRKNFFKITLLVCLLSIGILFQSCGEYLMKKSVIAEKPEEAFVFNPFEFGDEFFINDGIKEPVKEKKLSVQSKSSLNKVQKKRGNLIFKADTDSVVEEFSVADKDSLKDSQGYRIQIGVFDNREDAQETADNAVSQFSMAVYVEYKAPFFRVTLGDFKSRDDAEKLIAKVKNGGFGDARWVPSSINVGK